MAKSKKKFPDLTGDGKVTFADVLKGRLKKGSKKKGKVKMQNGGEVKTVKFADHSITSFQPSKKEREMIKASEASNISELMNMKKGGKTKSRVNEAGNYTKPGMRKRIFNRIKAGSKGGRPGQWSARKAQMLASAYKKAGGGYKD
jgi:hypothetical protein